LAKLAVLKEAHPRRMSEKQTASADTSSEDKLLTEIAETLRALLARLESAIGSSEK